MTTFKWQETTFGDSLSFDGLPDEADLVIVCIARHGAKPVSVLLPHQVYRKDLIDLVSEYPDARGFFIMPCSSKNWISIPLELLNDK